MSYSRVCGADAIPLCVGVSGQMVDVRWVYQCGVFEIFSGYDSNVADIMFWT